MGWSCRAEAAKVERAWTEACAAQTGMSNTWETKRGRYFAEMSRCEHNDGAITGTVYKFVDETRVKKSGSYRIEGNGIVTRGPAILKEVARKVAL